MAYRVPVVWSRRSTSVLQSRNGLWIGWPGVSDDVDTPTTYEGIRTQGGVDQSRGVRGVLPRILQRHPVAALSRRHSRPDVPPYVVAHLPEHQSALRRGGGRIGGPQRHGVDPRLPIAIGTGDAASTCAPTCASASSCTSPFHPANSSCNCRGAATSSPDCSAPTSSDSRCPTPRRTSHALRVVSWARPAPTRCCTSTVASFGSGRSPSPSTPRRSCATSAEPQMRERAAEIRHDLGDPEVVLFGVDRLDYTKGIQQRLTAVIRDVRRRPTGGGHARDGAGGGAES